MWLRAAAMAMMAVGVAAALSAYRAQRIRLYLAAKALASLGFVALAGSGISPDWSWQRVAFVALIASAVGDVALAFPGRRGFIGGLACFAVAHATFASAFVQRGVTPALAVGLVVVTLAAALLAFAKWAPTVPSSLRVPLAVYVVVISAMAATGVASALTHPSWQLCLGAVLVPGSDIAVARERFGMRSFGNKLFGLPAYYLGQALIALSLFG